MVTVVRIYTRKDKFEEQAKVKEIERVTKIAAEIINKTVDIQVSTDLRGIADLSVNAAMTPIVTINGTSAFAKETPNVLKMKAALLNVTCAVEMF